MRKRFLTFILGLIMALVFIVPSLSLAYNINFDDLTPDTHNPIPDGYAGFNWSNDVNVSAFHGTSGGYYLLDPVGNVAYNWYGNDPVTLTWADTGTFDFISADWTSAWDEEQTLNIVGYNGSTSLYAFSGTISNSSILHADFNWTGLTQLYIESTGSQWALDNMVVEPSNVAPVPEPSTVLLFLSGGLLFGLASGFRKLKQRFFG